MLPNLVQEQGQLGRYARLLASYVVPGCQRRGWPTVVGMFGYLESITFISCPYCRHVRVEKPFLGVRPGVHFYDAPCQECRPKAQREIDKRLLL